MSKIVIKSSQYDFHMEININEIKPLEELKVYYSDKSNSHEYVFTYGFITEQKDIVKYAIQYANDNGKNFNNIFMITAFRSYVYGSYIWRTYYDYSKDHINQMYTLYNNIGRFISDNNLYELNDELINDLKDDLLSNMFPDRSMAVMQKAASIVQRYWRLYWAKKKLAAAIVIQRACRHYYYSPSGDGMVNAKKHFNSLLG
jgi:hypothetical protein